MAAVQFYCFSAVTELPHLLSLMILSLSYQFVGGFIMHFSSDDGRLCILLLSNLFKPVVDLMSIKLLLIQCAFCYCYLANH